MSNLKSIRLGLKMSQKQLAEAIGQTPSSVGHYESGRRSPDIGTCHSIISAFNRLGQKVTFEEIFPQPANAKSSTRSLARSGSKGV
ncbi:helix-turn-helix transcriptional regulator [Pantoea sp. LMR881]|uniref:helix-turn-helix transcriptional regulator n=1 Tax=Pantoea sp. LMR881 TaxID=3014336 RepID=UPI0022AEC7AD|nr:helix-turn-helix transcriptional regulator [Pantoea sp. LMR881]MCZ4058200.1 helix-turn-helix transcriptional regulator [Pantoea sp. LMR881]